MSRFLSSSWGISTLLIVLLRTLTTGTNPPGMVIFFLMVSVLDPSKISSSFSFRTWIFWTNSLSFAFLFFFSAIFAYLYNFTILIILKTQNNQTNLVTLPALVVFRMLDALFRVAELYTFSISHPISVTKDMVEKRSSQKKKLNA